MIRTVFLALVSALALAGCAASDSSSSSSGAQANSLGLPLACDAAGAQICPNGGCTISNPGEEWQVPISLSIPAFAEIGRFCIATGCEDARYTARATRALGWTASVATGEGWSQPVGELIVSQDRQSFRLVQPSPDGATTWDGFCRAAGS
jgi:hypothetical protein